MESDECDFYELKKNNKLCKYFQGDILNKGDINHCYKHCSLMENKELMQDGIQPLIRRHGVLKQVRTK